MHGYKVMDRLEEILGKKPSPGQIYPLLRDMEEKGLIEISCVEGERKKKVYSLTDKGHKTNIELIKQFNDAVSRILEVQVDECSHCETMVFEGGLKEEVDDESLSFCCEYCYSHFLEEEV